MRHSRNVYCKIEGPVYRTSRSMTMYSVYFTRLFAYINTGAVVNVLPSGHNHGDLGFGPPVRCADDFCRVN